MNQFVTFGNGAPNFLPVFLRLLTGGEEKKITFQTIVVVRSCFGRNLKNDAGVEFQRVNFLEEHVYISNISLPVRSIIHKKP